MYSKNFKEPIICFTIDLDWAKEPMIAKTLEMFDDVPVTPFITHKSKTIEKHYAGAKRKHVGLHPNFWIDSTQGHCYKDVIKNLCKLWPEARGFRSHRWFEDLKFSQEFRSRGFVYDSTTCMFLHPHILPYECFSGVIQLPVFFEDRWFMSGEWHPAVILQRLEVYGLKVFDFHPIHIMENEKVRKFLLELLKFVKSLRYKCLYLDEVYEMVKDEV